MAYSNDQNQIRAGFVNYIGSLLKSSPFEERAARQNVTAILVEEALKLSQNEDNSLDMYTLKPLFKSIIYIFNNRIKELSSLPKNGAVEEQISSYKELITTIEKLVDMV